MAGHLRTGPIFTRGGAPRRCWPSWAPACVGLVDDWIKVRHQRSLGLNKRAKIAGQLIVAGGFAWLAFY